MSAVTDTVEASSEAFVLPASYAQQRLWFLDRIDAGGAAYNVPLVKRLRGPLDTTALECALGGLLQRHETLRTQFTVVDGVPHQLICPPQPAPVETVDVSGELEPETRARQLVGEHVRRSFDLAGEAPIRWMLIKLGHEDHILSLVVHHIVADGWSMGVLGRELSALYGAAVAGETTELPELPIQYGDYAVWQRDWIESGGLDRELAYWHEQLAGAPALLELPTDHPRPARQTFAGATIRRSLDSELIDGVRALSQRAGKTMFMTLLSAFVVLLHRYSGGDDIVVATPVAGRNRVELEGLIGCFVNTLAMRAQLHDDPTFLELVEALQETALGAFSNQELPFEKLVEALNPDRELSHAPVAQVMFVFQNSAEKAAVMRGLEQERLDADRDTAKFDLSMSVVETSAGVRVALEYCTDLFEPATIERMLGHFVTLLREAVSDPTRRVSRLQLLGRAEVHRLVHEWNATDSAYPPVCVHDLFRAQAKATPASVAVRFGARHLSYRELDERSDQLASHLLDLGVTSDVPVGICLERSEEIATAVLGVLKAGGAYVPIDPSYPLERRRFMLENSQAPVVITQESVLREFSGDDLAVVCLDRDWPAIAALPREMPPIASDPDQLAYLLYTSGSTGQPKGVQIHHRGLVNLLLSTRDQPGLAPNDVLLAITTLSFDIATLELLLPLITGAQVVIAPSGTASNPEALSVLLEQSGATVMQATPTTWRMLVDSGWRGGRGLKAICGGEALAPALVAELHDRGVEVWNGYGPTETTIYSARKLVAPGEPVTIGRPLANTTLYILDQHLSPVPIGVPGELWIGGDGLARGYRGRPDLTEERFRRDPFDPDGRRRIYRTGDVARYRPDGEVEYLGRADHQVKVRGYRIELGEIETVLERHPDLREAVVVVRQGSGGQAELVAYTVAEHDERVSAEELRIHLKRSLPDFMVPAAFVSLQRFPQTPNGKVDRLALPAPEQGSRASAQYVEPQTDAERELAALWAALLGVERVGREDNFFSLGGHSLLATKLVSRIREHLGTELPLRALFEAPTIAELGAVLGLPGTEPDLEALPPIDPVPRSWTSGAGGADVTVLPASYAEQRLWFLDTLEQQQGAYNLMRAVRLRGPLDAVALERALSALVQRHESLRTTFALVDGRPHQVVHAPTPIALERRDLSGDADAEQRAQAIVQEHSRYRFDLESGPLVRAGLLRLADDDHVLTVTLHHVITDMWSLGVFSRELRDLYEAFAAGRTPELAPLSLQYGDFAAWQQQCMAEGRFEPQLEYWKQQLAGTPAVLELPTDFPRPSRQSFRGALVRRDLAPELLARVRALGDDEGATLFMTLLAAFATLLHRYSGQDDIVIASPIANRGRVELEGLIGMFLNTLALRTTLDGGELTFLQVLHHVREATLGAFSNQDLPFEKLVEELNPERHLSHAPLAQVMFVLQNDLDESALELPGLSAVRVANARRTSKFDLTLFAFPTAEGLGIAAEYCTDLFEETTVSRLLERFETLLEAALADPARPVSRLALVAGEERRQVLDGFSDAGSVSAPLRCVHELVADQARQTPQAVAVALADRTLSYEELDAHSNRLANLLRELGVGPDVPVAVCTERSIETTIAVLAVLKAGGAYVPIDAAYPPQRIAFMLRDSRAPVLLTQSHLVGSLPQVAAHTLCLDTDADRIAAYDAVPPEGAATLGQLAYVLYTSGSTGQPKGVAMEHRPLANLIAWQLETWGDVAPARTLQFASLSFDVAFQEMFSTWCSGGALVLVSEEARRDPAALLHVLAERDVQRLFLPFVALQNLCEAAEQLDLSLPSLREVITAGEQLKITGSIRRFFLAHDRCALVNQYGPTESHVVTAFPCNGPAAGWPELPPIGRPVLGARIYVLDRHLEPVPIGVAGELCIGGISLARGYLSRPELTAERFVSDPFGADSGGRIYRTGDLARFRPDGMIEYLGRMDHQVKVRGYRIEPGEIEAALRSHQAVREALVLAREGTPGERQLVAYVIAGADVPSAGELREHLQRTLPEHMIPPAFVSLEGFPLSPNGKVDRQALPAPDEDSIARSQYTAPTTELERSLAPIWQALLGLDQVGIDDDFFDLGGHSLLAVQLVRRVAEEMRAVCTLPMLFRNRTIRQLAAEMHVGGVGVTTPTVLALAPDGADPALFCIGGVHVYQELADALAPEVPVYGIFLPSEQELFELERGRRHRHEASVQDMAADYLRAVRERQPRGPYMLLGLCFGGLVAYEAAQQLTAAGEEVALLVMCDTVLGSALKRDMRTFALRKRKKAERHARNTVNAVRRRLGLKPPLTVIDRLTFLRAGIYGRANARYPVRPYHGPALLVRPGDILAGRQKLLRDQSFGWNQHVSELEICDVPGNHQTHLTRPNVNLLLSVLRPKIAAARQRHQELHP